jgi:hypothetical protein
MKIAQHFSAGKQVVEKVGVPEGRLKMRSILLSRPCGTLFLFLVVSPALKRWATLTQSLRDGCRLVYSNSRSERESSSRLIFSARYEEK